MRCTGALLTDKVSENNGIFKVQYKGLRLAQRMQMPSAACMQKNYVPTCIAARKCKTIKAMASPTVAAPKREKDPKKRVVITGMGLVSVFGSNIDTFYNKLLEGESGISLIDRFDASSFPVHFGGQIRDFSSKGYIDGKNDRRLDDCLKYCLVAGKRALEDANLGNEVLNNMDKTRIGVLVGSGMGSLTTISDAVSGYIEKGHRKISPFFVPHTIPNMGSALLAIETGLMGPNYSISTACATANYCFYAASNHIRRGALSQRNEEPQRASRPWDKHRDGFVLGEGSGVLVEV
ncbi:3-oxoacyl-[acyl-carrier] synthase [Medicago truncatula]|uniref:beta-ketoacyl-[acyl-carrier-protein] synthase I n=2 Tax=Medicago truncatula TaxID=3880 RepID=A0A072TVR5_MEDTR|nr:3-oxoacyl-[acyl-carrier] synthase [Medicago truncatula]